MKTQNKIVIAFLMLWSSLGLTAQDVMFSQFYNTPLLVNPAQTGFFEGAGRAGISYRNQWAAVMTNPYETFAIEAEMKVKEATEKSGPLSVGLVVLRDRAGASKFSITNLMLSLGYMQQLNMENYLGAGIQAGYGQYSMDYANLFWGNQYDPNTNSFDASQSSLEPNINNKYNHFNVSGGLLYAYKTTHFKRNTNEGLMLNLGGSFHQAFIPKNSFYEGGQTNISLKYVVHVASHIGLSQYHLMVTPRVLYVAQGQASQFVLGSNVAYRANRDAAAFNLGLYYRLGDAFIPYIGLEFSNFTLGIAYDANMSDLGKQIKQTNGLEINLTYNFAKGVNKGLF